MNIAYLPLIYLLPITKMKLRVNMAGILENAGADPELLVEGEGEMWGGVPFPTGKGFVKGATPPSEKNEFFT